MLIDTHCHLDFPEFDRDRDEVIKRAQAAGIDFMINIGSSLEGSRKSVALAGQYQNIYASVGIHPHEADSFNKEAEGALRAIAKEGKVVAIGETGLDYYKNFSTPQNQRALFNALLRIAKEAGLPLVIHMRQAQEDTLEILKKAMPLKAVVHCFSGNEHFLRSALSAGFFISFTCNITYRKAENLRNMVKLTPLDRLMLETDAPFLAPEGLRGKRNEPHSVKALAAEVAALKGLKTEEVAVATTHNAKKFFGIK